ncbi:MAG: ABC transporter permease [Verrucomicrobiota bacterium]|nr:ABC transporter permease [Verrucomicrobiota bacterium]
MKFLKTLFSSDYGMLGVLVGLCVFFSFITFEEQQPVGKSGAERLVETIEAEFPDLGSVILVGRNGDEGRAFTESLNQRLGKDGWEVRAMVNGGPPDLAKALREAFEGNSTVSLMACEQAFSQLPLLETMRKANPAIAEMRVLYPKPYGWPNFLKTSNLLNVANQIAVIAIIAIGMTLVIVTAGIDLSVGSLIAFSAVLATWMIREWMGGPEATALGMFVGCLLAILVCGGLGLFSGSMVAFFGVPPFVASLGMMMVASGLAYMLSGGLSIYQLPESFDWLGRGDDLAGIPNAVVLMILLYSLAHLLMSRTIAGRFVYAVGGNSEAARLSGVPVKRILLWVYAGSGALAGLGGIVMASQFRSGDPKYGLMYELYVIAAVVVGGTSLSGGRGKVFGTLIGAFIIAVIQNGMNLTGVQSYTQKVVLGVVLLAAVLLDMLKKRGWKLSS